MRKRFFTIQDSEYRYETRFVAEDWVVAPTGGELVCLSDYLDESKESINESFALPIKPSKLVCLGKTYAAHAKEFDGTVQQPEPCIFLKSPEALCATTDNVVLPPGSRALDYEVELVVVIGGRLKNASVEAVKKAIYGYTLMCDYSEREMQLERGGQWTKGKSYESFAPVGPVFVTADEVPEPDNIDLELYVNGELRQKGNTSDLIMPIYELVAYVSQFMTLVPGDVISTGTPAGVALGMKEPRYLKEGDVVNWGSPVFGFVEQKVVVDSHPIIEDGVDTKNFKRPIII